MNDVSPAAAGRTRTRPADTGILSPAWASHDALDLVDDVSWVQAMLDVEVALAFAQADAGIIPLSEATTISRAARVENIDLDALAARFGHGSNPVVGLVKQLTGAVSALDPSAADAVHRGATSQDILDTAAMLVSGRVVDRALADVDRAADAAAELVSSHATTPMVARTLTQHAVPTTFGVKAATWLHLVLDVRDRMRRIRSGGLPVSLGGAGGTLAAYEEYARLAGRPPGALSLTAPMASRLGLTPSPHPWHGNRMPLADLGALVAIVTGAFGKIAADVHVMARTEIGEVSESADAEKGASSAMPQKHNPVKTTALLAASRQGPAIGLMLAQSMVTEDERSAGAWQAEWQPLRDGLRLVLGTTRNGAGLLEDLHVDPERMLENLALTGGAVVSERLSAILALHMGKARAARVLRQIFLSDVALATPGADTSALISAGLAAEGADVPPEDIAEYLDPSNYLGASEAIVAVALDRHSQTRD